MMICLLLCSAETKQTVCDSERILSAALYRLEDDFFLSLVSQGFSGVGSTDKENAPGGHGSTQGEGPVLPIQTRLPDRGRDSQPRPLSDNTQLDLLKTRTAKPSEPGSDLSQSPKPSEASASKAFSPRPEPLKSELPKPAESPKPASLPEKSPSKGASKGPAPPKGPSKGNKGGKGAKSSKSAEAWLHDFALPFFPNSVSTLRGSYGRSKGRCLIRVLTLGRGAFPVNFCIKWLL